VGSKFNSIAPLQLRPALTLMSPADATGPAREHRS